MRCQIFHTCTTDTTCICVVYMGFIADEKTVGLLQILSQFHTVQDGFCMNIGGKRLNPQLF